MHVVGCYRPTLGQTFLSQYGDLTRRMGGCLGASCDSRLELLVSQVSAYNNVHCSHAPLRATDPVSHVSEHNDPPRRLRQPDFDLNNVAVALRKDASHQTSTSPRTDPSWSRRQSNLHNTARLYYLGHYYYRYSHGIISTHRDAA